MAWYDIVIPIVTLVAGLVGGFFIGVYYLRKQMEAMQNNPDMLREMAKKMGYNVNQKQMNQMQQMLRNQPGAGGRRRK
ncbi:YneF family protein [Paenibacillus antri]|uniref:YneF family protein n=1 Tax=Paenibacillus antri TaxID=2582848 RepID=A0A5R9G7H4_9BACL|nr:MULTISPECIES: YneF family protein [Paenibacillus]TLS48974.1 YneF family protein [Paenibacillus antri]